LAKRRDGMKDLPSVGDPKLMKANKLIEIRARHEFPARQACTDKIVDAFLINLS
jgi:hypothetical protein